MKNIIHVMYCLAFSSFFITSASASNEKADNIIEASYFSELHNYNKFSPKIKHKSKVSMSKHGVRVESKGMFSGDNKGLYIQNFQSNKSWIVDPKNKTYSLIEEDTQKDSDHSNNRIGGIMATHPCIDSKDEKKRVIGKESLADDNIIIWSCDVDNETIKQGYSLYWKIVVWEELPNGNTSRLVNIKKADFNKDFYTPPKHFREVSLKEFYTGAPALTQYSK